MASWRTNIKHEPNSINGGNQYEEKDRLSRENLNAITENAFYAMAKADDAFEKANSAFQNNGTIVKINNSDIPTLNFKSDPQTQLDNKTEKDLSNLNNSDIQGWQNKLEIGKKTLLFEGTLTSPNSTTLPSGTSTDYDLLLVCVTAWRNSNNVMFIPTQNIIDTIDNKTFGFVRATQGGDVGGTTYFHSATFNNSTQVLTLNKTGYDTTDEPNNADYAIKRVYGIKLRTV